MKNVKKLVVSGLASMMLLSVGTGQVQAEESWSFKDVETSEKQSSKTHEELIDMFFNREFAKDYSVEVHEDSRGGGVYMIRAITDKSREEVKMMMNGFYSDTWQTFSKKAEDWSFTVYRENEYNVAFVSPFDEDELSDDTSVIAVWTSGLTFFDSVNPNNISSSVKEFFDE